MKIVEKSKILLILGMLVSSFSFSQVDPGIQSQPNNNKTIKTMDLKTYLIEREIPNAGKLSKEELQGISKKSNEIIEAIPSKVEWVHSYVTHNKVYCVYKAYDKDAIKLHAQRANFPVNSILEIATKIDPHTAHD